jgi:hypothetical protein
MAFIQFVVVTYALALENIDLLKEIFPNMWMWGVTFVALYLPLAILIGHLHRKLQMPTEQKQLIYTNPYIYYTQPGREQLFHFPVITLGLKAQLQMMSLQNAMADAIEKISKETGSTIPVLPRINQSLFREYEKAINVSERLTKGEHIDDILASLNATEEKEQASNATQ